jgi:NAD+ synthase (glutamine-hydrolysing)
MSSRNGAVEGFVRVAAAVPPVRVTDFAFNREHTLALWRQAHREGAAVVYFPELGLAAYTAGDLHMDQHVLAKSLESLSWLVERGAAEDLRPLAFVGLPLFVHPGVFNVAAAIQGGRILGVVPKAYLPAYSEFYEKRQFREGRLVPPGLTIDLLGQRVPFGLDLLFVADNVRGLVVGVEVCEDVWVQLSPSAFQASAGATVCGNLSGSNFLIGKAETRRHLCWKASQPTRCAYVYTAAGPGESSSDLAFDSHALIYERGECLAESRRFSREPQLLTADIDLEGLLHARAVTGTFGDCAVEHQRPFRSISFLAHQPASFRPLRRPVDRHPFVPKDVATLATRCWEVFEIQTNALLTRMEYFGNERMVLALSGGRDSTLAALACANALDQLGKPRSNLLCVSMPGFGTSKQTRRASRRLAAALGASFEEEDIREECFLILREQRHRATLRYAEWLEAERRPHSIDTFVEFLSRHPELADVELENVQARVRKLRVMTKANRHRAIEIGTGDLSEKALGWSTYAGDHISMYDLNAGIPKTLVEFVIRWVANERVQTWSKQGGEDLREVLFDILDEPISPELLPPDAAGKISQLTESAIGPYELHDFFLYWFVRHGTRPARMLFLAEEAFGQDYSREELKKWLAVFFRRFFLSQWKRNCTADGPKVGEVALSPRGDWRMPSDAVVQSWLEEIEGA